MRNVDPATDHHRSAAVRKDFTLQQDTADLRPADQYVVRPFDRGRNCALGKSPANGRMGCHRHRQRQTGQRLGLRRIDQQQRYIEISRL